MLKALLALDELDLIRAFLGVILTSDSVMRPAKAIQTVCEKYGWATFEKELTDQFKATMNDRSIEVDLPDIDLLGRNVDLLEAMCITPSQSQANHEERIRLCRRLASLFVANLETIDHAAANSTNRWQFQRIKRSAILAGLTRSLVSIQQEELLAKTLERVTVDQHLYSLSDHIAALTSLQSWLKVHLKTHSGAVSHWVSTCRERLELLTANEPTPPSDFQREAKLYCKCASCTELSKFLRDPNQEVYRFQIVQDRRDHLESVIHQCKFDLDFATERVSKPYTLVCKKNTASYENQLKKHRENRKQLDTIRAIEKALPK